MKRKKPLKRKTPLRKTSRRAGQKSRTAGQLAHDLWDIFRDYIILRHTPADIAFGARMAKCYTCGTLLSIGTMATRYVLDDAYDDMQLAQAGHMIPKGACNYLKYHEDNVRPQCYRCNINLGGNGAVFKRRMEQEIGTERVNAFVDSRNTTEKRGVLWHREQIDMYRKKVEGLLEEPIIYDVWRIKIKNGNKTKTKGWKLASLEPIIEED